MSCTTLHTVTSELRTIKGTLLLSTAPCLTYDSLDPTLSFRLLHPDLLRQILLHLPPSSLAKILRVSKDIYAVAGPILYSTISYFPDRYGPTPLDGLNTPLPRPPRRLSYVPNEDHHDSRPVHSNAKRGLLKYTKHLRMGYHHHEEPYTTSAPLKTHRYTSSIDLPNLRVLHVSGERSCVKKSCPYLKTARPKTVVLDKIDLFSGSPRWTHPFVLPCHATTERAIYLVTSPFFLREEKMQGLDGVSCGVGSSTFIFALREYEVEWRDTARRMSDSDPHSALVGQLVTLLTDCTGPTTHDEPKGSGRGEVLVVGLELVASHLRPTLDIPSAYPEDLVSMFEEVIHQAAIRRWAESGIAEVDDIEERLKRCRFMSMREYVAKELRDDELDRTKLDGWASCFEHVVASSGIIQRA